MYSSVYQGLYKDLVRLQKSIVKNVSERTWYGLGTDLLRRRSAASSEDIKTINLFHKFFTFSNSFLICINKIFYMQSLSR